MNKRAEKIFTTAFYDVAEQLEQAAQTFTDEYCNDPSQVTRMMLYLWTSLIVHIRQIMPGLEEHHLHKLTQAACQLQPQEQKAYIDDVPQSDVFELPPIKKKASSSAN